MIEDEVFRQKRFVPDRMEGFGFHKSGDQYFYETDFMNGDFHAILSVSKKGTITGKVIDKMNNEEYVPFRSENFNGTYVNSVRTAYKQWLEEISRKVCDNVLFASDQANRVTEEILDHFDVKPDFPWNEKQYQSYGVFRHADTKKWFALIMNVERGKLLNNNDKSLIDIINLKDDILEKDISKYVGSIFPGYHMNHKTWISIVLNDSMDDETVMAFIKKSYELT